jgi:hypothetical protein
VAGTLIGLLFVAMSVSPHKDVGRRAPLNFQVQAAVAFTTLIDTLAVALVALLPGNSVGVAGVLLACAGISSTIGMAVLSLRDWPGRPHLGGLVIIPVLGVLYICQLLNGVNLSLNTRNTAAVHLQALLVIVFFIIAIARAWQMIGARNTRVTAMISDLLRQPNTTAVVADTVEYAKADVAATSPAAVSGSAALRVLAADAIPPGTTRQGVRNAPTY